MIKVENVHVYNVVPAVYSARNALNSWDKSDSDLETGALGSADLKLAKNLVSAGSDHSKFMRMIGISMDITAPLYWWKEFDTYKVGTVANSCSTMHKIGEKEFTLDDFSHEHLEDFSDAPCMQHPLYAPLFLSVLETLIQYLNTARECYLVGKDKKYWWQMIQLLPSSYNQRRTVTMNYAVARNQYHARKAHKLDEWHTYCDALEALPYSELITMEGRQ